MYSEAKLAFFVYLWFPKTRGTTYVYKSFLRPYVAMHETEIDRNLMELRTRAGDLIVIYWQKAATYGQTRIFEVLQYVAYQSPSAHQPPPKLECEDLHLLLIQLVLLPILLLVHLLSSPLVLLPLNSSPSIPHCQLLPLLLQQLSSKSPATMQTLHLPNNQQPFTRRGHQLKPNQRVVISSQQHLKQTQHGAVVPSLGPMGVELFHQRSSWKRQFLSHVED